MFKTDDKLIQICLALSYAILALYGMINYFNPEYIIMLHWNQTIPIDSF